MPLPFIIPAALSAAGSLFKQGEANANAGLMTDAMNAERDRALKKNDKLGKKTRGIFDKAVGRYGKHDKVQANATADRTEGLMSSIMPAPEVPLSDTSDGVVQSALAKRMADAIKTGTSDAQRAGALGGFGDAWLRQSLKTNDAGRQIGVFNDLARGNMSLLPHLQQLAQLRSYKPSSGIGDVLMGIGGGLSGGPPVG